MKIKYFLLFFAIGFFTGSCAGNDDNTPPELKVSTEEISFAKDGETKVFHIKANAAWTVTSSDAWCTVNPSSDKGSETVKVEVTASANPATDARNATLTVKCADLTKQVKITQSAATLLIVKKKLYEIDAAQQEIAVELQVSDAYQVKINAAWLTASALRATVDKTEKFAVAANTTFIDREGTIEFTLGDLKETVTIKQKGTPFNIPADKTGMGSDAPALSAKLGVGWNLGNSLEATSTTSASETMWGNPRTSKTLVDAIKAAGFNTIRIPCAWNAYIEDAQTYKIKDSWLARVKEVIDYGVADGMYLILNIHWDGGWLEENPTYAKQDEVNRKQKALWEQIAVYFRDYDEHLLFAGTNEVHANYGNPTNENITVQMSYNQTFVDAVRSTGGKNTWRNLVVQAYNTNINSAVSYLKMPVDATPGRMLAEVHYYDPFDFCLDENSQIFLWGKDFSGPNVSTWGQESWVDEQFGKMKTHFTDKGIPVILGEYGVMLRASLSTANYANHIKARNYYLNYVTKAALQNGMTPVYWDSGATGDKGSGLFNRATGEQVHADAVQAIVSAK